MRWLVAVLLALGACAQQAPPCPAVNRACPEMQPRPLTHEHRKQLDQDLGRAQRQLEGLER